MRIFPVTRTLISADCKRLWIKPRNPASAKCDLQGARYCQGTVGVTMAGPLRTAQEGSTVLGSVFDQASQLHRWPDMMTIEKQTTREHLNQVPGVVAGAGTTDRQRKIKASKIKQ